MIDVARVGAALGNEKRYAILKAIFRGFPQDLLRPIRGLGERGLRGGRGRQMRCHRGV